MRFLLALALLLAACGGGGTRPPEPFTRTVPAGGTYAVCWRPTPGGGGAPERMELRLVEAGTQAASTITIPMSSWEPRAPGRWCSAPLSLPAPGRYWYEARACHDDCAPWVRSLDPAHAEIAGRPRAWQLLQPGQ